MEENEKNQIISEINNKENEEELIEFPIGK